MTHDCVLASRGPDVLPECTCKMVWTEPHASLCNFFQFHSRVSCALFSSFWQTLKNWTLLLAFHKSWAFIAICFILEKAAKNHLSNLCFIFQLIFTFVFFFSPICISCEASVDESTLEHTLNPKIFVCHSAVRTKKMVPGLDRASAHVCFKTAAHKL